MDNRNELDQLDHVDHIPNPQTLTSTLTLRRTLRVRAEAEGHWPWAVGRGYRSLDTVVRAVKWAYNPNHSPNLDGGRQP